LAQPTVSLCSICRWHSTWRQKKGKRWQIASASWYKKKANPKYGHRARSGVGREWSDPNCNALAPAARAHLWLEENQKTP
jgi:hypothetical protein